MGFVPELADALRARFTRQIVGGPGGSMGPTGTPTARGTLLALREHLRAAFDSDELGGRVVAVQGLGAVGLPLARLLADAGARLVVAETDGERLARAEKLLAAAGITVVPPDRLLETECDVLSPCAMGGILDETTIDALRCKVICGAANNQLHAVSREGEVALAARIRDRGIVYAPEWIHNIAGVVAGVEEYTHQDDARIARILPHLDRVCRDGVRAILARAVRTGRTPTELAYEEVEARIYPPAA
jgi:glutamate dehydrogenase/leucine dehydrogenase